MNWNKWIRQIHRWFSIAFVVALIINGVEIARGKYTRALGIVAVVPVAVLLFTGLYLFVLPYVAKFRSARISRRNAS